MQFTPNDGCLQWHVSCLRQKQFRAMHTKPQGVCLVSRFPRSQSNYESVGSARQTSLIHWGPISQLRGLKGFAVSWCRYHSIFRDLLYFQFRRIYMMMLQLLKIVQNYMAYFIVQKLQWFFFSKNNYCFNHHLITSSSFVFCFFFF